MKERNSAVPDELFQIKWSIQPSGSVKAETTPDNNMSGERSEDSLPITAPAPVKLADNSAGGAAVGSLLRQLMDFYLYGRRSEAATPLIAGQGTLPALLYPYRDLSRLRHDYPVCLTPDNSDSPVRSLAQIFDDVIAKVAADGDQGQRLKRRLLQLETSVKALVGVDHNSRLSDLWDQAAKQMIASAGKAKAQQELRDQLAAAQKALSVDGELLECGNDTPSRLLAATMAWQWRRECAGWRETLESLIQDLKNILQADFSNKPEALSAEQLRESVGNGAADDLDFDKMSSLLESSRLGDPLPDARRKRIEQALETLTETAPLFVGKVAGGIAAAGTAIVNDCAAALKQIDEHQQSMVRFFRAVHVAQLESGNRYREKIHDDFFEHFDATHLSTGELALCPPVLLVLDSEFFADGDDGTLLSLLGRALPLKILLQLNDLQGSEFSTREPSPQMNWPARLSAMALGLGNVFVLQSTISYFDLMQSGFANGLRYPGTSLFCVYGGELKQQSLIPAYLRAAAAVESRALPLIAFDPARGATWAERINLQQNPQCEHQWPTETLPYQTVEGTAAKLELAFTPADLLLSDTRFADRFWHLPPQLWHENLVPLHEYLELSEHALDLKVPYLTTVNDEGQLGRAIVTREVVLAAAECGAAWRSLRELGGIQNSFAQQQLADEQQRLAAEKQEEVAALEKKYEAELARDVDGLTKEIVQRIAQQLIVQPGATISALTMPMQPASKPAASPTEAVTSDEPATTEAEADEEEPLSLIGDPYIDTPLCTSCNECTKINKNLFAYNENKQAYINDPQAGTFRELVKAAELCPVKIIHPGKPLDSSEADLDALVERAAPFN